MEKLDSRYWPIRGGEFLFEKNIHNHFLDRLLRNAKTFLPGVIFAHTIISDSIE